MNEREDEHGIQAEGPPPTDTRITTDESPLSRSTRKCAKTFCLLFLAGLFLGYTATCVTVSPEGPWGGRSTYVAVKHFGARVHTGVVGGEYIESLRAEGEQYRWFFGLMWGFLGVLLGVSISRLANRSSPDLKAPLRCGDKQLPTDRSEPRGAAIFIRWLFLTWFMLMGSRIGFLCTDTTHTSNFDQSWHHITVRHCGIPIRIDADVRTLPGKCPPYSDAIQTAWIVPTIFWAIGGFLLGMLLVDWMQEPKAIKNRKPIGLADLSGEG